MRVETTTVESSASQPPIDAGSVRAIPSTSQIEARSIDFISHRERHGTALGQVPIWFMGQFQINTLSMGFIGPAMGLSLGWTVAAAFLGVLIGTLFMAFHATQGPVMGLPQMIQSRAQFGYRGVIIPLIAVLIDFIGYNVICAVIIIAGLASLFGIQPVPVVLALGIISCVLAIYGHDWVHRAAKLFFFINIPIFGLLTLAILSGYIVGDPATTLKSASTGFVVVAFGTQLAAAASNQIAYAPFVSDYTRYLPRDTPAWRVISAVFAGAAMSGFWLIALGAWFATHLAATDPLAALKISGNELVDGLGLFMVGIAVLMNIGVLAMDNYSSSLALITVGDSIRSLKPTKMLRIITVVAVTIIWGFFALRSGQNVVDTLWLILTILLYVLVPWTAVNLVDFFFVRHGHYAITHLFKPNGIYGAWGIRGMLAYVVGMVTMIPFMVLPGIFAGSVANMLGGTDIAWLVGLFSSGVAYFLIRPTVRHEQTAIDESNRELRN